MEKIFLIEVGNWQPWTEASFLDHFLLCIQSSTPVYGMVPTMFVSHFSKQFANFKTPTKQNIKVVSYMIPEPVNINHQNSFKNSWFS